MKHNFQLSDFPNSNFEIETSIWTGKSKLFMNNSEVKKSTEKGKPFLIPRADGSLALAFAKQSYPDLVPTLEIDGKINLIVEKLKWYEYIVGGLPIILIFAGGLIGGIIGVIASLTNFNIFRQEGNPILKYTKVIGVTGVSYLVYLLIVTIFTFLIK
ncbi:MAG: hypothetical protein ACOH1N_08535 [Lutibacter sp.]